MTDPSINSDSKTTTKRDLEIFSSQYDARISKIESMLNNIIAWSNQIAQVINNIAAAADKADAQLASVIDNNDKQIRLEINRVLSNITGSIHSQIGRFNNTAEQIRNVKSSLEEISEDLSNVKKTGDFSLAYFSNLYAELEDLIIKLVPDGTVINDKFIDTYLSKEFNLPKAYRRKINGHYRDLTVITYIRDFFHHGKDQDGNIPEPEEIEIAISKIIEINTELRKKTA